MNPDAFDYGDAPPAPDLSTLAAAWDGTPAAPDEPPLPAGESVCRVTDGRLLANQRGTPEYRLTFEAAAGPFAGRCVWYHGYLTPKATARTKRELAPLGITTREHLERPFPPGFVCRVAVRQKKGTSGTLFNEVVGFRVERFEAPPADDFAPSPAAPAAVPDDFAPTATPPAAVEPPAPKSAKPPAKKRGTK